jgi:hypothetical protein
MRLLSPILTYQEVLSDAILIEFNIRTGVVLSVFHGDSGQTEFVYTDDGTNGILGPRSMGNLGYEPIARQRRQGFYGVGYTGGLPDEFIGNIFVILRDSYDDSEQPEGYTGTNPDNILFANITVLMSAEPELEELIKNSNYNVLVNGIIQGSFVLDELGDGYGNINPNGFYRVGDGIDEFTVVWILDYVSDVNPMSNINLASINPHSRIQVEVRSRGYVAVSNPKHPHFSNSSPGAGMFDIGSARHLYNIRHVQSGASSAAYIFNLRDGIDFNGSNTIMGSFPPIPHLRGTFNGNGNAITGLGVNTSGSGPYGLFGVIHFTPELNRRGMVTNLTLNDATVSGNGNAGGVAGISHGDITNTTVNNSTISGNGNAGGVAGISHGNITNTTVNNSTISGSGNAGGVAGISNGYITNTTVFNPTISGSENAGGVAGISHGGINTTTVNNLTISGENTGGIAGRVQTGSIVSNNSVRYDIQPASLNNRIQGTANAGGLVGINNGVIRDSVFISPYIDTHITGTGNISGFVGRNDTLGTMERLILLATAPSVGGTIYPVVGEDISNTLSGVATLLYLQGVGIRPSLPPPSTLLYNPPPSIIGIPADTNGIREIARLWPGWELQGLPFPSGNPTAILLDNLIYPYPVFAGWVTAPLHPHWPIAIIEEEIISVTGLMYFENYGLNDYGFFPANPAIGLPGLRNNTPVLEAGYMVVLFDEPEEDDTDLNFNVMVDGETTWTPITLNQADIINRNGLLTIKLPLDELIDLYGDDNHVYPLRVFNRLSPGPLAGDLPEAVTFGFIHPYFAQAVYSSVPEPTPGTAVDPFIIRTPWQMQNISHVPDRHFIQRRNMDFDPITGDRGTGSGADLAGINAVVTGKFSGTYNGFNPDINIPNGIVYRIRNVRITTGTNGGLFENNDTGTIRNLILTDFEITVTQNAGALAGESGGLNANIENIVVENPRINGGSAGGLVGVNSGDISGIYVRYGTANHDTDSYHIHGIHHSGGIAGVNSGNLTDSMFMSAANAPHVQGGATATLGGMVGTNTGNLENLFKLAFAPETGGDLRPIIGAGAVLPDETLIFLEGEISIRPGMDESWTGPFNYKEDEPFTGVGRGMDTISVLNHPLFDDWAAPALFNHPESTSLSVQRSNVLNPYPLFDAWQVNTNVNIWPWPIAVSGNIYIGNIYYFENYGPAGFGFDIPPNIQGGGILGVRFPLRNDRTVYEAGYMVILPVEPASPSLRMYARPAESDDPLDFGDPQTDNLLPEFFPGTTVGLPAGDGFWVARLDLDRLAERIGDERHVPLELSYGHNPDDEDLDTIIIENIGFLHPFFAKAIFDDIPDVPDDMPGVSEDNPYIIRTPWQMQNISRLTEIEIGTGSEENLSNDMYFIQERLMNFEEDGSNDALNNGAGARFINPDDSPVNAVVTGSFGGTFDGAFLGIEYVTIDAPDNTTLPAGLFERNEETIQHVVLRHANITGQDNTGAIAGYNAGIIERVAVEYSEVDGEINVGGVAGINFGTVRDAYFISMNEYDVSPVTGVGNVGGIVGTNAEDEGEVTLVFYFAPAPLREETRNGNIVTIISPIIGAGDPAIITETTVTNTTTDNDGVIIVVESKMTHQTAFYLRGHRHYMQYETGRNPWVNRNYNFNLDNPRELFGGGRGLVTNFMDMEWLINFHNAEELVDSWWQPTGRYPYPKLVGMDEPRDWPVSDSPARPDQVERDDWALTQPSLTGTVEFINSDFSMPLMHPITRQTYGFLSDNPEGGVGGGGFLQVPPGTSRPDSITNLNPDGSVRGPSINPGNWGTWGAYYAAEWFQGWSIRPATPNVISGGVADRDHVNRFAFELQRPSQVATHGRARTDHLGRGPGLTSLPGVPAGVGVWVELNADIPSTVYQIAPTVPETQVYYSFFHAARNDNRFNSMHFLLSGMTRVDGVWEYNNGVGPSVIRPAITPRGDGLTNPRTRDTVVYGPNPSTATNTPVPAGRVNFFDPNLCLDCGIAAQPTSNCTIPEHTNRGGIRNAWLIDVWVGTPPPGTTGAAAEPRRSLTGQGRGITFWYNGSNTAPAVGTTAAQIPLQGVADITTAKTAANQFRLPPRFIVPAQNNIIGYWDVLRLNESITVGTSAANGRFSEWKQYYGIVTIPEGQVSTEFAFQSNHETRHDGNLVTGITLQSPGLVTIDNYVRMQGEDITFVQPGNVLDVEMMVRNIGEVFVNNIILRNQLYPFQVYYEYVADSLRFNGGPMPTGSTINLLPSPTNVQTVEIILPPGFTLGINEHATVSFQTKVRDDVFTTIDEQRGVSTFLYYFENQAEVSYFDTRFNGVSANALNPTLRGFTINHGLPPAFTDRNRKHNASGVVTVFIDPIRLDKQVTSLDRPDGVDGPWRINLSIENTLYETPGTLQASGLINVIIPRGFTLSQSSGSHNLPANTAFAPYPIDPNVPTRMTIRGVNVNDSVKQLDYFFTLEYVGDDDGYAFGVPDIIRAEFRYLFEGDVGDGGMVIVEPVSALLAFPSHPVGLSIRASDVVFFFDPPENTDNHPDFIYANTFELLPFTNTGNRISIDEGFYTGEMEIILLDEYYQPVLKNAAGNFQIITDEYIIELERTGNTITFQRLVDIPMEHVIVHYHIDLILERTGAIPPEFDLSSPIYQIVIVVTPCEPGCICFICVPPGN